VAGATTSTIELTTSTLPASMAAGHRAVATAGRLSAADHAWWRMTEPDAPLVAPYLMHLDGHLSRQRAVQEILPRILLQPKLSRRIDGRRWQPTSIDPSLHITEHHVKDGTVEEHLSGRMSRHLDEAHPPWRLELLHETHRTSIAWIVHHALADGLATSWLMQSLSDHPPTSGHPAWIPPTPVRRPRATAIPGVLARLGALPRRPSTPYVGALSKHKRIALSEPLDVKAATQDMRLDDALLTWVAGGLRRDLLRRGCDCPALHAAVPMNVRPPNSYDALGNVFGAVFLQLPVHLDDPTERLAAVRIERRAGHPATAAHLGSAVFGIMGAGPRWLQKALERLSGSKTTVVLSHLPTQAEPLQFCGRTVTGVGAWAPVSSGVSVTISLVSYLGEVRLCIATDAAQVGDPHALLRCIEQEITALEAVKR
jgi:diacylglycerol O-acyltransferase